MTDGFSSLHLPYSLPIVLFAVTATLVLGIALAAVARSNRRRGRDLATAEARGRELASSLDALELLLHDILDAQPAAILVLDTVGKVRHANSRALQRGVAYRSGLPDQLVEAMRLGGAVIAVERTQEGGIARIRYQTLPSGGFLVIEEDLGVDGEISGRVVREGVTLCA